jgi:hypothetical protein
MKYLHLFFISMLPIIIFGQKQKKADAQTSKFRYEIEAFATGIQGSYQVKVWSYAKDANIAIEQAKKNAVHGIIFKGFPNKERIKGQKALAGNHINLESEKADFFKDFFAEGGKYLKYITLANNGAIMPGDRIKISKKEYKIGVIVNVNVADLRKDLEQAGIIKSLSYGF